MIYEYKLSEQYNIIVLQRKQWEYYVEKVGYGNFMYAFSTEEKIEPSEFSADYIWQFINYAEEQKFWGDE